MTRIMMDDWNVARNEGQDAKPLSPSASRYPPASLNHADCMPTYPIESSLIRKLLSFFPTQSSSPPVSMEISAYTRGSRDSLGVLNKEDSNQIRWRSSFCIHGPACGPSGASKDHQGPRLRPLACLYVSAPKHPLLLLHLFPYRIF